MNIENTAVEAQGVTEEPLVYFKFKFLFKLLAHSSKLHKKEVLLLVESAIKLLHVFCGLNLNKYTQMFVILKRMQLRVIKELKILSYRGGLISRNGDKN